MAPPTQHPDRLGGLVYLEAADDPTLALADYNLPPVDKANQPKRVEPPALDYSSFDTDEESLITAKWENDLRAGVPTAKIVEFPGASLYMFLSNEADVVREIRTFVATLQP